jgi:hypothetical protein
VDPQPAASIAMERSRVMLRVSSSGCVHLRHASSANVGRHLRQLRHCAPVRLSRSGCSFQYGLASAPIVPQAVQTMRRLNDGTTT